MLKQSVLQNQIMGSALRSQSTLKPTGGRKKRNLMFALTLTSLIDAFSILVIYLLINFGASQSAQPTKNVQLPTASQSVDMDLGTVVAVTGGHYFIDDREVALSDLAKKLYEIRFKIKGQTEKMAALIIHADKRTDYATLSPVIQAGAQAGFQQYRFAVVQGGVKQ